MLNYDTVCNHFLIDNGPVPISPEDITEMNSMDWWHSIPFGPKTSPIAKCDPAQYIKLYQLDKIDFTGKSVLDIGCWDGFQCFYAEAMGAKRVVGLDDLGERNMTKLPREFAKRKLHSNVNFVNLNVYNLTPENFGKFDIVMMFGVLYHLVHPMLGIQKACSVCNSTFVIATHYAKVDVDTPVCILYPNDELDEDQTNWSGANIPWIESALEIQGFKAVSGLKYHDDRVSIIAKLKN